MEHKYCKVPIWLYSFLCACTGMFILKNYTEAKEAKEAKCNQTEGTDITE